MKTLLASDPPLSLTFTTDQMPGYKRVRRGKGFSYVLPDGGVLANQRERLRILSLAVPPAYESVWICRLENGHLQATGIDARGRKQYRYHPAWHELAADRKFGSLDSFVRALPKIRAAVRHAMKSPDLDRSRVIAGIVWLLDQTGYRIGNSRYVRENGTFGLSSLLSRHLKEEDGVLKLKFRGKAGFQHEAELVSPRLAQLVSELQELPGQHLFSYEDDDGNCHDIATGDVNQWLKEISGGDFTAKQFRTWKATLICAGKLAGEPVPEVMSVRKRIIMKAIRETALALNHTAATCRKYYIHPAILRAYESGQLQRVMQSAAPRLKSSDGTAALHADERRVYRIITAPSLRAQAAGPSGSSRASGAATRQA